MDATTTRSAASYFSCGVGKPAQLGQETLLDPYPQPDRAHATRVAKTIPALRPLIRSEYRTPPATDSSSQKRDAVATENTRCRIPSPSTPEAQGVLHATLLIAKVPGMRFLTESSNYRPGEPLRKWDPADEVARRDINLVVQKAEAGDSLWRLMSGSPISNEDLITFGLLNSWCVQDWWEPLVMLISPPRISSEDAQFLRQNLKIFRDLR